MRTKIRSVLALAVLILSSAAILFAQNIRNDWNEVKKLSPGSELFIRTKDGKTVRCVFQKADDSQLVLNTKSSSATLSRDSIQKINLAVPKSRHGAKLATTLAFVAGLIALGFVDTAISPDWPTLLPFLGAAGAAALTQHLLTKGMKKGKLIYKSK